MTPEQIRAVAIDRIARARYEVFQGIQGELGTPSEWREIADTCRRLATEAVDALGDMIPTGREFAARWKADGSTTRRTSSNRADIEEYRHCTFYGEPVVIESLWTHDWQEDRA